MRGISRKSAVFAVSAVLAFSGAGLAAADSGSGHHEHWTHKQCKNQTQPVEEDTQAPHL
jgi:hypothetical protein